MFAQVPFTAAQIRELAHDPQQFLRDLGRDDDSGYGYPEEAWRYGALDAFHRADRSLAAAAAFLGAALERGCGPSTWKVQKLTEIDRQVKNYALRDQRRPSRYVGTLYQRRPLPVTWRGHRLALRPVSALRPMGWRCAWSGRRRNWHSADEERRWLPPRP